MPNKVAIAYIPVLHRGYMEFIQECERQHIDRLFLIGDEVLSAHEEFDYINRKDRLRALTASEMRIAIGSLSSLQIDELTKATIEEIQAGEYSIFTPQEDIGRVVVDAYFKNKEIILSPIFVRWNKDNIDRNEEPDGASVSMSDFQKKIASLMREEADKSLDWWRQVGAALIQGEEIIFVTHNTHMPEEQEPYINGDARSLFKKGININYVTAAHAEVVALGSAAKEGVATDGADLYVTDFPCPYCARLIASAGIRRLYFLSGYAVLEGDTFLKGAGVEIIKLEE